ncbi:NADH oxidase [Violaceomyces palustris]|uniref:NADH oxidase n=1 Tax=Violaceomyces palustris TaxID=1673888 RepID=A0ACD0NLR4_9BASI|nr:NADH oxidase [Violaceomyces palustris]
MSRYEQDTKVDQSILGDSIALPFSGKVAPSRFMKGAMTERLSSWDQHDESKRGVPSDELVRVYQEWGKGGFGVILSGNVLVNPRDLEAPGNAIISEPLESEARIAGFRRLAEGAKANGSLFVIQLSHAGRQVASHINDKPVSASDVQLKETMGMHFAKPTPLTVQGIKEVVDQFAYAAHFAHKTGADGVQLHAAHGYLLAQFLAPSTNRRTDQYGGSLENRARIIYEIIDAIRARVADPTFSISLKINSAEFQQGGFTPEECKEVCKHLESLKVDFVELSGGTYEELAFTHKRESSKAREAFFLEFADIIRPALQRTKVYVTGGFRTASAMVKAIQSGSTDGIGLARPACQEFDLPDKLIRGEVASALKTLLDEQDFGITNLAAGTQMRQVGKGKRPFDSSDPSQVERFKATVGSYMAEMGEKFKSGVVPAGYPDL